MKISLIRSRREFMCAGLALLPFLKSGARAEDCRPTVVGEGGPFYREGAPWRTALCGADERGEPLSVSGRVTEAGTCRAVAGAVVDVWQADAAGRYDNDGFHLRGRTRTDAAGRYHFETVLPGNYPGRARHIHYIVSAPGYARLTTECYFAGEERNRTDRLVRPSLIIPLSNAAGGKKNRLAGAFDIALARAS